MLAHGSDERGGVVEVINDGARVYAAPSSKARRVGAIGVGTRLRQLGRMVGEDCDVGWVQIGKERFVCSRHLRAVLAGPGGEPRPRLAVGELLPHRYAFVAYDGTRLYERPNDYFVDRYFEAMGQGFGLVVRDQQELDGIAFLRTRRGLWVERDALRFARPSTFHGVRIAPGEALDHAWVLMEGATVHRRPAGAVLRRVGRRQLVHIERRQGAWAALRGGGYMRRAHLAEALPTARPEGVSPEQQWIDVDTAEQLLVVYRGDQPLFVTLVSTGREPHPTARGLFPIWAKLAYSDMDDLTRADVTQNYAIEAVPWVQYFNAGTGLHATFWHDDFGRPRSHGCVNLSPTDARTLFAMTEPALPAGWTAILPRAADRPTLVRVR